jgi:SAM-dependent methyltransferase
MNHPQSFDPTRRFSDRAEVYRRFRPGYPSAIIDLLTRDCGLHSGSDIADIGAGTGLLTERFLQNGNRLFAVEPNAAMRRVLSELCTCYPLLTLVDTTAEATGLQIGEVDFITVGTAFHWFDLKAVRREFRRILKADGWVVIATNERRQGPEPFFAEYEDLILHFGKDYPQIKQQHDPGREERFFAPGYAKVAILPNYQDLDLEGFEGRILSSSYMPLPGTSAYPELHAAIVKLFEKYQREGQVRILYDCRVRYGQLEASK